MNKKTLVKYIREAFGEELAAANQKIGKKIGAWKGAAPVGAPSAAEDVEICPECGMMMVGGECGCGCEEEQTYLLDKSSTDEAKTCDECGMMEVEGSCGCSHLEEVAPEGGEHVVRALKKNPEIDNPWAVAWSMKNKGQI